MGIYIKSFIVAGAIGAATCFAPIYTPLKADSYVMEVFFSIFGVIYAIIAGFVMLVVLNNHGDVRQSVRLEVNALRRLRDYLKYIDNPEADEKIKGCIKTYCESVLKTEWPDMVSEKKTCLTTSPELHQLMESIKSIDFAKPHNSVALGKIMDAVGDVVVYRSDRLASSREKLPPMLKFLVLILSVFLVIIFTLMPIEVAMFRILCNCINSFALAYIYLIILDLNNPFTGLWTVTSERMENFISKI